MLSLQVWFCDELFNDSFVFYKGYHVMKFKSAAAVLERIEGMARVDPPQAYGLHSNADITSVYLFFNSC